MANFIVTNSDDNGVGSLRDAINQANSLTGADRIVFDSNFFNTAKTIRLTTQLIINDSITIEGLGQNLITISGDANNNGVNDNGDTRLFFVNQGTVNFSGLTLTGGRGKGGDGGNSDRFGGGGGLGAGGALFINNGTISVANVTFAGNQTVGGKGGDATLGTGNGYGGGGGFGGNGGNGISSGAGGGGGFRGKGGNANGGGQYIGAGGGGFSGDGSNATSTSSGAGGSGSGSIFGGSSAGSSDSLGGGIGGGGGGGKSPNSYSGGSGSIGGGGAGSGGGLGGNGGDFGGGGGDRGNGGWGGGGGGYAGVGGFGGGAGGSRSSAGTFGGAAQTDWDGVSRYGGGGGAGLGGAIFIRQGSLNLANSSFQSNSATGGVGGTGTNAKNGGAGQGKGGAIFVNTGATVRASGLTFTNNDAGNQATAGQTGTGTNLDTDAVYGTLQAGNSAPTDLSLSAANISGNVANYIVNLTVGTISIQGSIQTKTGTGGLSSSSFSNWNLTITQGTSSTTLTSANSSLYADSSLVAATTGGISISGDSNNLGGKLVFDVRTSDNKNRYSIVDNSFGVGNAVIQISAALNGNSQEGSLSTTQTLFAASIANINENVAANTTVGAFSSTDPDTGNTFTYSLVSGTGSTDNSAFTIVGNELKINASPDFETKSSYNIRVRTTDQGGLSYDKALSISVNNQNETPTDLSLSATNINENVAVNTTVGTFTSTDPDAGNTFTYSLVSGIGSTDNSAFTIVGNELKINASPDFETKSSYNIRVRTTDQGGLSYDKALTVNINDVNEVTGTVANEVFAATKQTDSIDAGDGNDRVSATFDNLKQNDTINGGAGTDTFILTGGSASDSISINLNNPGNVLQGIPGSTLVNFENFDFRRFAGNTNFIGSSGNDSILGGLGADTLTGGDGNDTLRGGAGNDNITGGAGNDTLDGGTGDNILNGGTGNDTYVVISPNDVITENLNEGTDTVQASVSYTLGANLENLTLTGNSAIDGTGNELNNTITGNIADNYLAGGDGNDSLRGGDGDDTLDGGTGNDSLDGGTGSDTLIGGIGNDTYTIDADDIIIENAGEGTDTVIASFAYTLGANLENLTLSGSSDLNITGNEFNNTLKGNAGNNTLTGGDGNDSFDGGAGNDTLIGGTGNDSYIINDNDIIIENANEGTDTVSASISYTLAANVENLTLTGTNAIDGTGNELNNIIRGNTANNTLTGGDGNDSLDGGAGSDTLIGGIGNDTYTIDANDTIIENVGEGTDTVITLFNYTLGANLENLTLSGSDAINGTGNILNNTIRGNTANNTLSGNDGNDYLLGGAGNDLLLGGNGNDTLTGDAGNDILTGGAGNDRFLFNTNAAFASTALGVDSITDFAVRADKIFLDKSTFTGLASVAGTGFSVASEFAIVTDDVAASTSSGMIVYNSTNGKLFYNENGIADGLGMGAHFVTLNSAPLLTANDFTIQV